MLIVLAKNYIRGLYRDNLLYRQNLREEEASSIESVSTYYFIN